ncbi:NTF2 fold immunity protein [Lysobacter arvi]|uniref:NTF2 fold immunity protein n=1 Tax=Lysobacter arvi TaxID=3038776 RepID=A0ABU1CF56_9GAMM|nr:NTF2 fold immunity protein [Lysobacter arvi]MDR0183574.1 NTF2 fold immunity protein [Lysobacter arvi]
MKRYLSVFPALVIVTFLMLSCGGEIVRSSPRPNPIEVANSYVTEHYPDFDPEENPAHVRDGEDVWIVEYMLPDSALGGPPVVTVSKKDLKVVSSYRTQ